MTRATPDPEEIKLRPFLLLLIVFPANGSCPLSFEVNKIKVIQNVDS